MTVTIKNVLVAGPVAIPLSTGQWLRLSPGEQSAELPDFEATDAATGDADAGVQEAAEDATPAKIAKSNRSRSTE